MFTSWNKNIEVDEEAIKGEWAESEWSQVSGGWKSFQEAFSEGQQSCE